MIFIVPKTDTVITGKGKPFCAGTLCLMLQMGQSFWVAPPGQPENRAKLLSCRPGLPDGRLVPKGTKTYHYILETSDEIIPVSALPASLNPP